MGLLEFRAAETAARLISDALRGFFMTNSKDTNKVVLPKRV
jgi:hypothetical protein